MARKIGWELEAADRLRTSEGRVYRLPVPEAPAHVREEKSHNLRERTRQVSIAQLVDPNAGRLKRGGQYVSKGFRGVEKGVYFAGKRGLANSVASDERGVLVMALTGAFYPRERRFRHERAFSRHFRNRPRDTRCLEPQCAAQGIAHDMEHLL